MAQDMRETEDTDLIDVSDIEPSFENAPLTASEGDDAADSISGLAMPNAGDEGPQVADFKGRFSALVIDSIFLYIFYWISMIVYRSVAIGDAVGPIPVKGGDGIIFHSLFALIALLWFVIPEMAFGASVGKLFCNLAVRKTDGSLAPFSSVLVRNILLPVDIVLSPLWIGTAIMERSGWRRRIGDVLGGTLVLKKLGNPGRQYALSLDMLASASGRAAAFAIDLVLFAGFIFGLGLMLSPENILASQFVVVISPVAALLFFVLPECLTKTSPGKWIFGYAICMETGSAVDITSSIIRSIWRVFDSNPFGFYGCLMSARRQRPGDTSAQTLVISASREWRGFIGLMATIVVVSVFIYAGLANRDSFLSGNFETNFLPSVDVKGFSSSARSAPANLITRNFTFAAGDPSTARRPSIYQPGETLFIIFEVEGFKRADSKVWLQEDMSVRYPDDTLGLKIDNISEFNQELPEAGPVRFENNITIPSNAAPGRYAMTITIRDKLARQELKEQRFFYVTPPGSPMPPPMQPETGEIQPSPQPLQPNTSFSNDNSFKPPAPTPAQGGAPTTPAPDDSRSLR